MYDTYIKNPTRIKKGKRAKILLNRHLESLLKDIAKKYIRVKSIKQRGGKRRELVLYDPEKKIYYRKNTIKFVAQQASIFVRKIPSAGTACLPDEHASKHVSCRQILNLLNTNSGRTTVNGVFILIVIIQLLQYSVDSKEFIGRISEDESPKENEDNRYNPERVVNMQFSPPKNCAIWFLGRCAEEILSGNYGPIVATQYLGSYFQSTSEKLDELVSSDSYLAVRFGEGKPPKQYEFKDILPRYMPNFPCP